MAKKTKAADLSIEKKLEQALVVPGYEPYKIPDNWCWTNLKTVCNLDNGIKHNNESLVYFDAKTLREITEPVSRNSGVIVEKGQKVILVDGENSGEVFVIPDRGYMGSTFRILNISKQFDEMYIRYFIDIFREELKKNKIGSAIPHLNKELFYGLQFPLPPLPEQQRIVERIESLFSKLDEAKEKAQEVIDSFETRKAAILHKAFSGELTAKWREENGVGINEYPVYRFSEVAEIKSNLVDPAEYQDYPHIAPDNIEKKTGVLLDYHTIREDGVTSGKHRFYPGQILYSKIRPNLSKLVIVDFDGLCSADMYPIEAKGDTKCLWYYMLSEEFLEQASSAGSRSVLPKINQKELSALRIRMPSSIDEQKEISRLLDSLIEKEYQSKQVAESVIDQIDTMKKAILARAFRGELGTNDPEEESAVEMLKEILSGNNNKEESKKQKRTRIVIPKEIDSLLKTELERKIIKLFLKSSTGELTAEEIMAVSSKKFDILNTIRILQKQHLIIKSGNKNYTKYTLVR